MTRMNGLELALQQALERRDAAARVVAQARQGWAAARAQLDQLETYASECTDRWAAKKLTCVPWPALASAPSKGVPMTNCGQRRPGMRQTTPAGPTASNCTTRSSPK